MSKEFMKHNQIDVDNTYFKEDFNGALTIIDGGFATQSEIDLVHSMLSGDMALSVSPATLGNGYNAVNTAIAGDGFTRTVSVSLINTATDILTPFSGSLPVAVAAVTAGDGDASIPGASLSFTNGVASVVITYTGTWAAADTCTLTVGNTSSILGYSISNATSVDTLVDDS